MTESSSSSIVKVSSIQSFSKKMALSLVQGERYWEHLALLEFNIKGRTNWIAHFGLPLRRVTQLGSLLQYWRTLIDIDIKDAHLLWFLYFCWCYPRSWKVAGCRVGVGPDTFRNAFSAVLNCIYVNLRLVTLLFRTFSSF